MNQPRSPMRRVGGTGRHASPSSHAAAEMSATNRATSLSSEVDALLRLLAVVALRMEESRLIREATEGAASSSLADDARLRRFA